MLRFVPTRNPLYSLLLSLSLFPASPFPQARAGTYPAGTTLVFEWTLDYGVHDVSKLPTAAALADCDFSNAVELGTSSGTEFVVPTDAVPGSEIYLACGTEGHCSTGQVLTITVAGAAPPVNSGSSTTVAWMSLLPIGIVAALYAKVVA